MSKMPTLVRLTNDAGLSGIAATDYTTEQQAIVDGLPALLTVEMKEFTKRKEALRQNKTKLYHTAWGQCTDSLKADIRGHEEHEVKSRQFDSLWLLEQLKVSSAGTDRSANAYHSLYRAIRALYTIRQGDNEQLDSLTKRIEGAAQTVKLSNGSIAPYQQMVDIEQTEDASLTDEKALDIVEEKFLAIVLIESAHPRKFGSVRTDLQNDMLKGVDNYPHSLSDAYNMLSKYKIGGNNNRNNPPRDRTRNNQNGDHGQVSLQFFQGNDRATRSADQTPVAGTNGFVYNDTRIWCYTCGRTGHKSPFCPSADAQPDTGFQGMQVCFAQLPAASQAVGQFVHSNWLLLDSGSTFCSANTLSCLTHVSPCAPMRSYTNGGSLVYTSAGPLKLLPNIEVYYNPSSLANIVSLSAVASKYRTVMDSHVDDAILVFIDQAVLRFRACGHGLYYFDFVKDSPTPIHDLNKSKPILPYKPFYSFFSTVSSNKEYFTRGEIEGADQSRILQPRIGWPSTDYKHYLATNQINDCPISIDDISRAEAIYGPLVPLCKGKMVRKRPQHSANIKRIPLPPPVLQHHRVDTMSMDFLFVHGHPYLLMRARNFKFQAINACRGRGKVETSAAITAFRNLFTSRGLNISTAWGDNEFEKVREHIRPLQLETVGRGEHVGDIERSIRVCKERVRCTTTSLPYKKYPKIMVDHNLQEKIFWGNAFAPQDYISGISPAGLVLGHPKVNYKHIRITFGAFAEVYDGTDNTQKSRSESAIALRPHNNKGSYYFMSLKTGRLIRSDQWRELPIDEWVIDRVHELAEAEGAQELVDGELLFEWEPGNPVLDVEEQIDEQADILENVFNPNEYVQNDQMQDEEPAAGDENEEPEIPADEEPEPAQHVISEEEDDQSHPPIDDDEPDGEDNDDSSESSQDSSDDDEPNDSEGNDNSEHDNTLDTDDDAREPDRTQNEERVEEPEEPPEHDNSTRRSTRTRKQTMPSYEPSMKGKSYGASFFGIGTHITKNLLSRIAVNVMFNQMTAKQGIKLFGEKAIAAMLKEYKQLASLKVFGRAPAEMLTPENMKNALRAINLIKEKRCGKIKGRTCADGRPHRTIIPREEAKSPTLSLEALIATLVIDAKEDRDVATFDVPGAYLHADLPKNKFVLMKFEDEFVDIMCEVNPEFKEDIRYERGKKVLYVQILKAIYRMIESALLWYDLYSSVLLNMNFKINPYDQCVANATINGKQCTMTWYVDDNKLSHVDSKVNDEIIATIEKRFPGLVITRGKEHIFLGMKIKFIGNGLVEITLQDYLKEAIETFGEDVSSTVSSPAAKWLFQTDDKARKLGPDKVEVFHSVVAKLLWISQRARHDLGTAISFLCTRVSNPDVEDWKKLKRALCYVNQTIDDPRIIGADDLAELSTYVDASHAVHMDMRGHTGGVITMGTGVLHGRGSKQKMNSRSSNETEVIGNSEYLPFNIWFTNFLTAQG